MTNTIDIIASEYAANDLRQRGLLGPEYVAVWDNLSVGPIPSSSDPDDWERVRSLFWKDIYGDGYEHRELAQLLPARRSDLHDVESVRLWLSDPVGEQLLLWRVVYLFGEMNVDISKLRVPNHPKLAGATMAISPSLLSTEQTREITWAPIRDIQIGQMISSWTAYTSGSVDDHVQEYRRARNYPTDHRLAWRIIMSRYLGRVTGLDNIRERLLASVRDHGPRLKRVIGFSMAPGPPEHLDQHGDGYLYAVLKGMAGEGLTEPLVAVAGALNDWGDVEVTLTEVGREVLDEKRKALEVLGQKYWVGSVKMDVDGMESFWREDLLRPA